jgi:toxin CptA
MGMLIMAHCAVIPLVWLLSAALSFKCAAMLMVVISLYYYLRQDALLNFPCSVVSFTLTDGKNCALKMRNGNEKECTVLGISYVSAYLTVLILQPVRYWRMQSVIILPDSVDAEEFRRLRVLLRWRWKRV